MKQKGFYQREAQKLLAENMLLREQLSVSITLFELLESVARRSNESTFRAYHAALTRLHEIKNSGGKQATPHPEPDPGRLDSFAPPSAGASVFPV